MLLHTACEYRMVGAVAESLLPLLKTEGGHILGGIAARQRAGAILVFRKL